MSKTKLDNVGEWLMEWLWEHTGTCFVIMIGCLAAAVLRVAYLQWIK
jgi:hypothetical protein